MTALQGVISYFSTGTYKVHRRASGTYVAGKLIKAHDLDADATVITPGTDTLSVPAHGLVTGAGPLWLTTDGVFPLNLAELVPYWAIVLDVNNFKLAASKADAIAATPVPVDIGDSGSGILHVATFFMVDASLQSDGGRKLQDKADGERGEETQTFWCNTELKTRSPGYQADVVEADGSMWRVDSVDYMGVIGQYYTGKLVRIDTP